MKLATRSVQVWSSDQANCLFYWSRERALQAVEDSKAVIVNRNAVRLLPSILLVPDDPNRNSHVSHCAYCSRDREIENGHPYKFKFLRPVDAWAFRLSVTDCFKASC